MAWEVVLHSAVKEWILSLDEKEYEQVMKALNQLQHFGPTLGRPIVERIKYSEFSNMKELRPLGTTIRILFIFDSKRRAIALASGDKKGNWRSWYQENIAIAEKRYREHKNLQEG